MSDILAPIENLPEVSFIDDMTLNDTLTTMINDYQDKYKELTGTSITLAKADTNRLILNACALQIYQGYQFIDRAGKQDLLKYSYGIFLDNLGALRGVTRNTAQPAKVIVRFTLSTARESTISIPIGTRVAAGEVFFESTEYKEIYAGNTSIDIKMECTQDGEVGNGFLAGEITTLVDPIGYVASVSNTTASSSGSETEEDKRYVERIYLAPSSYSVAGPEDAYIYWVKTYSSDIADVGVKSPLASVIDIRFILTGGEIPDVTAIQGLQDYITDKKIKPLTDHVIVAAPDVIAYTIELSYWIKKSSASNAVAIQNKVNAAISDYITWQCVKIGRDINPSELIKRIMAAGAKRVEITTPAYTVVTNNTAVASLSTQSVTYGGLEDD